MTLTVAGKWLVMDEVQVLAYQREDQNGGQTGGH